MQQFFKIISITFQDECNNSWKYCNDFLKTAIIFEQFSNFRNNAVDFCSFLLFVKEKKMNKKFLGEKMRQFY